MPGRVPQVEAGELTLDDFAHHEVTDSVEACPAGHAPLHVTRDAATHSTVVVMPSFTCASYAARSGIESTNSGLKNRLSLGWLRVRGRGAVFRTILLKVSGWNVLRAAASKKLRAMIQARLAQLLGARWASPFGQSPVVAFSPENQFPRSPSAPKRLRFKPPRAETFFQSPHRLTA